ncbi:CgeB family protein [Chryseobacterium jejuense]|uniref:Uncharacterized protein conserved in bacteria n=1 Tax=Chryseobacterium jejuense TaxID=445960 RepID=A0A2X2X6N9_CHRJE|nr:hypothetical protein [Chryseobacterium jejuense]SDJ51365.1 hypothetical protein SAMN05421542_3635 [Chryseobacterium jejuense]SQB46361.1 Uncharacterized protein conserved in bacteria [Chryseobacterium jejuense]
MLEDEFKGKSIVIAIPNHFGLPQRFKENLEAIGLDVLVIPDNIKNKIGFTNTLIHGYKKFIEGTKTFKREKKAELKLATQVEFLNKKNIETFDYALVIRPDMFSSELINIIKERSKIITAYQWDGLDRFPLVYSKIDLFDRFFVFDVNDLSKNEKLLPLTNFYFDDIPISKDDVDVYFVGTYMKNRIDILLKLANKCEHLGLKTSINLNINSVEKAKKYKKEPINIITKPMSFTENIINVSKSKIILDFANDIHYGISMRTFETIGYRKKLITNNKLVKKYDFYNPNNIFVIEDEKLDGLEKFLSIPYEDLPDEINTKYSFTNWIKYVLDIRPHIPINLQK